MYLWGADDRAHCRDQVRPLSEFNPNSPPAFAFITPTLCNDGHDCPDAVVDRWASAHVQPVLQSHAYAAGKVAVFIWYDEDHPVPNLWITPTARGAVPDLLRAPASQERSKPGSRCWGWPVSDALAPHPTCAPVRMRNTRRRRAVSARGGNAALIVVTLVLGAIVVGCGRSPTRLSRRSSTTRTGTSATRPGRDCPARAGRLADDESGIYHFNRNGDDTIAACLDRAESDPGSL